ncbi:MAG: ankyrin repeat domain-containing protein [Labilithrix sp.]|nr:ankyrin repeat domain-containing protein [Labilithrix sp.]
MSRSEGLSAKVVVVAGVGLAALGLLAVRTHMKAGAAREPLAPVVAAAAPIPTPVSEPLPQPEEKASPPKPTQADRHALVEAVEAGDLARVEALAAKGVGLQGTLAGAARSGNAALIGWLVDHGVDVHEDEDMPASPLLLADEHDAAVKVLLAKGAREPSLAKAAAAAAPKAVARLLAKGASPNSKSPDGEPALMMAVRDGAATHRRAVVDALLAAGADASARWDDESALSIAVGQSTAPGVDAEKPGDRPIDVVSRLVARGAKVDGDVLVSAMSAGDEERGALLDLLLGGKLDAGATAQAIARAASAHDAASIKRIGAKGVAWGKIDKSTPSPLEAAIIDGDVAVVRALLDVGAPTDRTSEDGDTALLAAVAAAAGEGDDALRVVRVLLDRGVSPNKRGRDGRTPLFVASQQGSEVLVALLLSRGARIGDAVDGRTPIEIADSNGHREVVKLLESRGARRRRSTLDD